MAVTSYDEQRLSTAQQNRLQQLTDEHDAKIKEMGNSYYDTPEFKAAKEEADRIRANPQKEGYEYSGYATVDNGGYDYDLGTNQKTAEDYATPAPVKTPTGLTNEQFMALAKELGYVSPEDYAANNDKYNAQMIGLQTQISNMQSAQDKLLARQQKEMDDYKAESQKQYDLINSQYNDLLTKNQQEAEYAKQQQVNALQRSYEDSIKTYEQERSKNALAAVQARDNMALYNAKAGDTGGLGSRMMESQNAYYDKQLLNIDLAQAQNKQETERAVADAIADGDYAKAQAILEVGIQKQNALLNQFNTVSNTLLNTAGQIDSFYLTQRGQDINQRGNELSYFTNLLGMGIFDAKAAEELGVPADQAQQYADYINKMKQIDGSLAEAQLEQTLNNLQRANNPGTTTTPQGYVDPMQKMLAAGVKDDSGAYRWLVSNGYNDTIAQQIAAQFPAFFQEQQDQLDAYYNDPHNYMAIKNALTAGQEKPDYSKIGNKHSDSWVYVDDVGRLSYQELTKKVDGGQISESVDSNGMHYFTANPGYTNVAVTPSSITNFKNDKGTWVEGYGLLSEDMLKAYMDSGKVKLVPTDVEGRTMQTYVKA